MSESSFGKKTPFNSNVAPETSGTVDASHIDAARDIKAKSDLLTRVMNIFKNGGKRGAEFHRGQSERAAIKKCRDDLEMRWLSPEFSQSLEHHMHEAKRLAILDQQE